MLLITRSAGISKVERASGTLQPIDTGDIDAGILHNHLPQWDCAIYRSSEGWSGDAPFPHERGRKRNHSDHERRALHVCPIARRIAIPPTSRSVSEEACAAATFWSVPRIRGSAPAGAERACPMAASSSYPATQSWLGSNQSRTWTISPRSLPISVPGRLLHQLTLDMSALGMISFSPDGKAHCSQGRFQWWQCPAVPADRRIAAAFVDRPYAGGSDCFCLVAFGKPAGSVATAQELRCGADKRSHRKQPH